MLSVEEIKSDSLHFAQGGMLPSVFAAQAILESGVLNGGSSLARNYNNYFGIKAGSSWSGETVNLSTKEEYSGVLVYQKDDFRVYESPEDSFADRANLLLNSSRYKDAWQEITPEGQANALQRAGYATDSSYAKKIIQIIDQYDLRKLDKIKKNMKTAQISVLVLACIIVIVSTYLILKG